VFFWLFDLCQIWLVYFLSAFRSSLNKTQSSRVDLIYCFTWFS